VEGETFHTRPDRPWDPPSILYNGYQVFLLGGGGGWRGPPTPSNAMAKERVVLFIYSPSVLSWPVLGWTLPYFLFIYLFIHLYINILYYVFILERRRNSVCFSNIKECEFLCYATLFTGQMDSSVLLAQFLTSQRQLRRICVARGRNERHGVSWDLQCHIPSLKIRILKTMYKKFTQSDSYVCNILNFGTPNTGNLLHKDSVLTAQ
jgi:hypothetical protein